MADGDFHDPWNGRGRHFSKRDLLEVAVKSGAIYTATVDGEELPYYGARFHADELEAEGFFLRYNGAFRPNTEDAFCATGARDFQLWVPSEKGKESLLKP